MKRPPEIGGVVLGRVLSIGGLMPRKNSARHVVKSRPYPSGAPTSNPALTGGVIFAGDLLAPTSPLRRSNKRLLASESRATLSPFARGSWYRTCMLAGRRACGERNAARRDMGEQQEDRIMESAKAAVLRIIDSQLAKLPLRGGNKKERAARRVFLRLRRDLLETSEPSHLEGTLH